MPVYADVQADGTMGRIFSRPSLKPKRHSPRDDVRRAVLFNFRHHEVQSDGEGDRHSAARSLALVDGDFTSDGALGVITIVVNDFVPGDVAWRVGRLRHPLPFAGLPN